MGRFHDELVNARRTAPVPAEDKPTHGPDLAGDVTFRPPSDVVPVVCSRCGGLVDAGGVPGHVDWHRRTGT